jgi:subtilase family serine protease
MKSSFRRAWVFSGQIKWGLLSGKGAGMALALSLLIFPLFGQAAQVLNGHVPKVTAHLSPMGELDRGKHLDLAISLPWRNQAELAQLLHDISDPSSPKFRHYLTPQQFTGEFGPTKEDYQAVMDFAQAHGLKVTSQHGNRMLVDVNGSVADIEQAFHVRLRTYQHPTEQRAFYAPDNEPSLDLAVPVLHIDGLDNYLVPKPMIATMGANITGTPAVTPDNGSGPDGIYTAHDLQKAYLPGVTLNGAGQKVALLEIGTSFFTNDIVYYETNTGFTTPPNVPVQPILLDGFNGDPGPITLPFGPGGGSVNRGNEECSLDIEMAIAMAPGLAAVLVYEGYNPDDMLNRMATDNAARQISISWSGFYINDQILQELSAQGQSVFLASGDTDAYPVGQCAPPSDDPYLTVVGGTELTTSGSGAWQSEAVWNWDNEYGAGAGGVGSSGGVSGTYAIPSWQYEIMTNYTVYGGVTNYLILEGSTTMRNTPDVAMVADNIYMIFGGDQLIIDGGGTSAAAPSCHLRHRKNFIFQLLQFRLCE